jgi:AcrR family transcriptional regulator
MEKKTRKPTQKRSIEKYEKIVAAAYKLINEQGYHNITTADIAREAGVATGSIYSYFTDKKDIFIEILRRVEEKFIAPTHDFWEARSPINLQDEESIKNLFEIFIKLMMDSHDFSKIFHDDITILDILDPDIRAIRGESHARRQQRTIEVFEMIQIPFKNPEASNVFLHYCNLLIDDVCHTVLYDNTIEDKNLYIDQAVDMLYKALQNLTVMPATT